ncbi:NAD-dependent epimerase/dehydratase family protein [Saccharothrix violaceirubra]
MTGATGNVGTALLRRLAAGPDVRVHGVSRRRPDPVEPYAGVDWTPVDLAREGAEEVLSGVFADADAVVHLAWKIQPGRDETALFRTNVAGSDRVFHAAVAAGVRHLVHLSSVGAYSPAVKDRPKDETWPTDGVRTSAYSRHKAAVERILDGLERDHPDLVVSRVRPGLILQPEAASELRDYFLGPLVPTWLFRTRVPLVPLPDNLVLQFVHADDVADALALLVRERIGGAVNLAAEPVLTPRDLAAALGGRRVPLSPSVLRFLVGLTWRLRLHPSPPGWLDLALTTPVLDTTKARDLGWKPRHDARSTLRALVKAMGVQAAHKGSPPLDKG